MEATLDRAQAALAAARGAGLAVERGEVVTVLDACVVQGAAYVAATGRGDPSSHLAWLGVSS